MEKNRKIAYDGVKNALIDTGFVIDNHLCLIEDWPNVIEYMYISHLWDGGYNSGHGYNGSQPEFENDTNVMLAVLEVILSKFDVSYGIWAPPFLDCYFENWSDLKRYPYYHQAKKLFKSNHVDINSRDGIKIRYPDDIDVIRLFLKCGFAYLSRGMLLFPDNELIVKAYHHMNIRLFTKEPGWGIMDALGNVPQAKDIIISFKSNDINSF